MPFHGRPSDACGPCRKGRLKVSSVKPFFLLFFLRSTLPTPYALQCDRIRPSCTQCMRKSIICFGYRNVSLLLFKDESDSTARKVQWEKNGELYPATLPRQRHEHGPLAVTDFNTDIMPSPSCSLTPSHDELAVGYFMSSYVPASPFYYLPEIYNATASTAQDAVSSTVLAASFASLSLHVGSGQLMNNARMHYSKALTQTNMALASPDTAILDSSLISVLMLGFYEAIAFSSHRSPTSWMTHTLGAVQLIRLRGTKQLKTDLGTRLFLQTCNNIRSSCIQLGVPVPDEFLQLYEQAKPFLDPSIPNVRIGPLLDKIVSLRVRLLKELPVQSISGAIHEALVLDEETRALKDMLPDSWRYHVRPLHMTPRWAYQGLAHQYPEHRVARHWNILRLTRLFLNEVVWHMTRFVAEAKERAIPEISRHCKDLDARALQAIAESNRTQIITDILASVPHFLDENCSTFVPAARFLIWPLTIVAERAMTPEPARRYAIWCMHEIARQARVPQALHAAEAVESGSPTDW
jgi:Fungal specific transcription factor domain